MVTMKTPSLLAAGFPRLSTKLSLLLAVSLLLIPAGRATAQTFTVLHTFTYDNNGAFPEAGLILSGNTLYGTTSGFTEGGDTVGSVFAVNTDGTSFTLLHSFTGGSDGAHPHAD
jgi:hypothetical protein